MDPVILSFYAVVCSLLGGLLPTGAPRMLRFGIGALVGILAAGALPMLRTAAGI